jgi:hypothetical protein
VFKSLVVVAGLAWSVEDHRMSDRKSESVDVEEVELRVFT